MTDNQRDPGPTIHVTVSTPKKSVREIASDYATIVLSLCALALSIFSIRESMKQERISVMPQLVFYTGEDPTASESGVYISNSGLGPAISVAMREYVDGIKIDDLSQIIDSTEAKKEEIFKNPDLVYFTDINTGTIRSSEQMKLLRTASNNIGDNVNFAKFIYNHVFIIIEYQSAYGEYFVVCNRASVNCLTFESQLPNGPTAAK